MTVIRRRVDPRLITLARDVDTALRARKLEPSREVGAMLVALGIEQLEQLGYSEAQIRRMVSTYLDAPVKDDARAHTGGT